MRPCRSTPVRSSPTVVNFIILINHSPQAPHHTDAIGRFVLDFHQTTTHFPAGEEIFISFIFLTPRVLFFPSTFSHLMRTRYHQNNELADNSLIFHLNKERERARE